jgi:hypothetical protein
VRGIPTDGVVKNVGITRISEVRRRRGIVIVRSLAPKCDRQKIGRVELDDVDRPVVVKHQDLE